MNKKVNLRIEVLDECYDDDDEIPLSDFINHLRELYKLIPPECHHDVTLRVQAFGEYGFVWLNVYYTRPETDEEAENHRRNERDLAERRAPETTARERAELKRLMEKYGE